MKSNNITDNTFSSPKNKNAADVARHYFRVGKYREARLKFEKWLRKNPEDTASWLDYMATLRILGFTVSAEESSKNI